MTSVLRHPSSGIAGLLLGLVLMGSQATAWADFDDVSNNAGFDLTDYTYGLAWADFDTDGDLDLLTCRHFDRPVIYRGFGNGSFTQITPSAFESLDHHGPVVCDFDDDGDPDVYLTGGAEGGTSNLPKHFYRNDGGFNFVDITAQNGLEDPTGRGRSCSAVDVNGDGAIDIFVAKASRAASPNSLFLNDGAGNFTDIAASAGLADTFGSVGGIWGDYDRDGDPDLFISGEESETSESRLYRNEGDLTFTDVTPTMLPGLGRVAAAAWGDYDKDGDLDLALGLGDEALFDGAESKGDILSFFLNARADESGMDGIDFTMSGSSATFELYQQGLYDSSTVFISDDLHNPGAQSPFTLTFAEAQGAPPVTVGSAQGLYIWTEPGGQWRIRFVTTAGIGDNYGGVVDASGSMTSLSTSDFEPYVAGPRGTRIYRNDGNSFTDVTLDLEIDDTENVRNVTWVDYDKDGDLDLHVLVKGDTEVQNEDNILYRNRFDHFTDETGPQDAEGPTNGLADACAWGDYDDDGDFDLAILSGSPPRVYTLQETDRLYKNRASSSREWLRVDLQGTISSRDGLGAWVTCVSDYAGRQSHYVTANSWRGGQVPIDPYFALRWDDFADSLIVEWPSGIVTTLTDVPSGDVIVVEDPQSVGVPLAETAPVVPLSLAARPVPSAGRVVFQTAGRSAVEAVLEIVDTGGRRVWQSQITDPPGTPIRWRGRAQDGRPVAPGVYWAILREGAERAVTKVVLIR